MKLTPEKIEKWKNAATSKVPFHGRLETLCEAIPALIADLEEANARADAAGNMSEYNFKCRESLREELADVRKQLAEAQNTLLAARNSKDHYQEQWSEVCNENQTLINQLAEAQAALLVTARNGANYALLRVGADGVEMSDEELVELLPSSDWPTTALDAAIAEAIEKYRKDAERLDWLEKVCKETPLNQKAFGSEIAPDTRLRYDFPTLVSYDAIGQKISIRDAIDAAIAAKGEKP
jgi:chromosome segregation ATPase